jgi:hypothetical protein
MAKDQVGVPWQPNRDKEGSVDSDVFELQGGVDAEDGEVVEETGLWLVRRK